MVIGSDSWPQRLRTVISRLAAGADEQRNYLQRLGTSPSADELALEFDDVLSARFAPGRQEALDPKALQQIQELDAVLRDMSGADNAHLWTVDALETSAEWSRVRQLAAAVLAVLG
jgi:succinate dehydrogenase/fumarate reductase flavoprotein subunit